MTGHSDYFSGRCGGLVACSGHRSVISSTVGDARACYRQKVPNFECSLRLCYGSDRSEIWTHDSLVLSPSLGTERPL